MTGTTPRAHGDRVFQETLSMPDLPTIADTFRNAGYEAYGVGKLQVHPQRDRIGFDDVILDEEGRQIYGIDLNRKTLDRLDHQGAKGVSTDCGDFAEALDAVLLLVVNARQVEAILFESGLAKKLPTGIPIMVSSTISSDDAKEIDSRLREFGLVMLDAPVSGGAVKASQGEITVMAAGPESTFEKLRPVLDAIAKKVYKISSEIGSGSTAKTIHQLLAGVHIAAEAEAMAVKANIPLDLMYEVITNAAGNSWMFEDRMKHVVEGDYSPKSMVDIFVKDLGLVVDTAKSLKLPSPFQVQL